MLYHSCRALEYGMSFFRSPQGPWTVPARHFWAFQSPSTKSNGLVLGNWIRIACSILHLWSLNSCFPALLSSGFPPLFDCFQYIKEERNHSAIHANAIQLLTVAETVGLGISGLHGQSCQKTRNTSVADWMRKKKLWSQAKSWATRMYTIWYTFYMYHIEPCPGK